MKIKTFFPLKSDQTHIWFANLSTHENEISYLSSILSGEEHERANSFKFYRDKRRFIVSRGILKCLLAKYLNKSPSSIEILYGFWGKPSLSNETSLQFNLSHSGEHALYALALDYKVGVDLEYIDKNLELEDLAFTILSPLELFHWQHLSSDKKTEYFFKLWVSKEAILKASGKGWLENEEKTFGSVCVFKKNTRKNLENGTVTYPYYFKCIPGYASAIFIEGPPLQPLLFNWS